MLHFFFSEPTENRSRPVKLVRLYYINIQIETLPAKRKWWFLAFTCYGDNTFFDCDIFAWGCDCTVIDFFCSSHWDLERISMVKVKTYVERIRNKLRAAKCNGPKICSVIYSLSAALLALLPFDKTNNFFFI